MKAFCYASGHIYFGPKVPEGGLPIAEGPPKALQDFISGVARHGYANDELFVPGVPECEGDQDSALDALLQFTKWIGNGAPEGVTTIHSKHKPRRAKPRRAA